MKDNSDSNPPPKGGGLLTRIKEKYEIELRISDIVNKVLRENIPKYSLEKN